MTPQEGWPCGVSRLVESPTPVAIGFCVVCGANARGSTSERGVYDCPDCAMQWYDERVEGTASKQQILLDGL